MTTPSIPAARTQPDNPFAYLCYVPRLPPTAYALLLHLLHQQQPGGLVRATHEELAAGLALDRGVISRAMPHLVAARLVYVVGRGRLQLHPMVALYATPQDRYAALSALAREDRLDVGHFEDEYEKRLALRQAEKERRQAARRRPAPARGHLRRVY
ncbi:hypothetical protein OG818_40490 [Streptomyces virginiae]|uniref:hypothetical protein n=1 Tax=Streptomyces virginiae TaxID=1961 RepID=UPI002253F10A|nr:hypothetical protein [Streptomyces virginiae]MCX4721972.1 hypothetical protein [Streptomyces virginiae]